MLEDLLKYNKLGNKEELEFLLFKALPLSESQKIDELKKYCSSYLFTIGKSFNGMLKLLEYISFIKVENNKVLLNKKEFNPLINKGSDKYFEKTDFVASILIYLKNENSLNDLFNAEAIKYIEKDDRFYIKENFIPYKYFPFRNLFLSIGMIERDKINSNHLLLNKSYNECFQIIVINDLQAKERNPVKRKITHEQLKEQLVINEKNGREAENFVEKFEKRRLNGHILLDKIKIISEEFVNAGYDIESFENRESIIIDRYIEVKSFNKNVTFYWSKGEVNTAKDYGDKYYLYLVDRDKMNDEDYSPSIFQNPYQKIFENEYWKKEIEKWKIILE